MKDLYYKLKHSLNKIADKYAMVMTLTLLILSVYRLITKYLLLGKIKIIALIICLVGIAWLIPVFYQFALNFNQKRLIELKFTLSAHISFLAILMLLSFNMIVSDSELIIALTIMMCCINMYFLYMFKSPYVVNDGILFGALRKRQDIESYHISGNQNALVFKTDSIIAKGQTIDLKCEQEDIDQIKTIFTSKVKCNK